MLTLYFVSPDNDPLNARHGEFYSTHRKAERAQSFGNGDKIWFMDIKTEEIGEVF